MREDQPVGSEDFILEIIEGPNAGMEIPLSGSVELGRDTSLPQALDDEQASRHHARLTTSGAGVAIEDLGSSNGTYVNDQPIEGPQRLRAGDRVRVGLTVLELRAREQVTVQRSAVEPAPEITALGRDVLEVVPEEELAPVEAAGPNMPGLLVEESEPAFVASGGDARAEKQGDPNAVARLVDVRVKSQTNVAAFALLGASALAVLIYFGVR